MLLSSALIKKTKLIMNLLIWVI